MINLYTLIYFIIFFLAAFFAVVMWILPCSNNDEQIASVLGTALFTLVSLFFFVLYLMQIGVVVK